VLQCTAHVLVYTAIGGAFVPCVSCVRVLQCAVVCCGGLQRVTACCRVFAPHVECACACAPVSVCLCDCD